MKKDEEMKQKVESLLMDIISLLRDINMSVIHNISFGIDKNVLTVTIRQVINFQGEPLVSYQRTSKVMLSNDQATHEHLFLLRGKIQRYKEGVKG